MHAFIIPLIHHQHQSVGSYHNIFSMLYRTLQSLKKQRDKVLVIVICHILPPWSDQVKKFVKFIQVESTLWTLHHRLDYLTYVKNLSTTPEETPEDDKIKEMLSNPSNRSYLDYLSLNGMYHNKDKGLKYYLGLLYLFKYTQRHQIDYVGLVDGDDFFHRNLSQFLTRNHGADLYVVERGYLLFSEESDTDSLRITDYYPIRNFSNICGSNRFFQYKKLSYALNRRLHAIINANHLRTLYRKHRATSGLIDDIMLNVREFPNAWSILPNFLGTHRLNQANRPIAIHPFQDRFSIARIPFRAAIKSMHSDNHSYTNPEAKQDLLGRYRTNGIIESDTGSPPDKTRLCQQFGLSSIH